MGGPQVVQPLHAGGPVNIEVRTAAPGPRPKPGRRARPEHHTGWSIGDRVGLAAAWAAGISLCVVAAVIVLFMAWKGLQFLHLDMLTSSPEASMDQSKSGGFLDPLVGTLLLTVIGIAIAVPVGVGIAVWLTEYGKPAGLARLVESGVEVVAGTPSIVLAIFGLLVFQQGFMGIFSFTAAGGAVFGRSFIAAGSMMALIALPLVIGSTREALNSIPRHVREASYALGKDRASTIRRVLLPSARSGIATGATLGMGRICGDTAIVVVLLGASMQTTPESGPLGLLRGTGSTLTSYVYNNSPAGEGNAPDKAYAAAFVLLMIVLLLNFVVGLIGKRNKPQWN
ncbi:MAG: phosphate ABC transporter permease PstA [Solirubrobacterales bacterium]|nr:phosphate ABC transporter permease PstA [Solirubrobacterales bacterium]